MKKIRKGTKLQTQNKNSKVPSVIFPGIRMPSLNFSKKEKYFHFS